MLQTTTYGSKIEKIGLHLWETGSFSNKLGFISGDIDDGLTTIIHDSTVGKYVSTSRKCRFTSKNMCFNFWEDLFSLLGNQFVSMNSVSDLLPISLLKPLMLPQVGYFKNLTRNNTG